VSPVKRTVTNARRAGTDRRVRKHASPQALIRLPVQRSEAGGWRTRESHRKLRQSSAHGVIGDDILPVSDDYFCRSASSS